MGSPVKIQARVVEVRKTRDQVAEYVFEPLGRVPAFRPGQYLHLTLEAYDWSRPWPESRIFSIASSAAKTNRLRLVMAVKGPYTLRIYQELRPGDVVWLKLPYGSFSPARTGGRAKVFLAGGTGVAPFVSYLETCLDQGLMPGPIRMYYGMRSPAHLVGADLFRMCRSRFPEFEYSLYCQEPEPPLAETLIPGLIPIADVFRDHPEADFFISGPWAMIESFRNALRAEGVSPDKIIIDDWD